MIIAGKRINGVIFDVDGTLLDSMPIWENVGNEFLIRRNIIPRENLAETFKTMSLEESASYYQDHYGIMESREQIINGILDLIREAYETSIPLKAGVIAFLKRLDHSGIPMSIATATETVLIEAALKRTGIHNYFKRIVTCSQVGYSKEYPHVYDEARKYVNSLRENTLVVEDAAYAAKTAKMAGYIVLGIYDAAEEEEQQLMKYSDRYVTSWNEVKGIGL